MKPKKEPVGTCECPLKGCEETAQVFKYQAASEDPNRRRHANKLYCICPKHGRIESNEFLLEKIKWRTGPKSDGDASPPVEASPVKTSEKPASAPVRSGTAPVVTRPAPTAGRESPPVAPDPPQVKKPGGWLPNFWSDET